MMVVVSIARQCPINSTGGARCIEYDDEHRIHRAWIVSGLVLWEDVEEAE